MSVDSTVAGVAVTGAAGKLGRAVVDDLLAHGYRVVAVDRVSQTTDRADAGEVTRLDWDGRDVDGLSRAITDCRALIHLAAIPSPYAHPHQTVFSNNTTATYAALQAAADAGIRVAAIASSGAAYGSAYSPALTLPRYVPVDEERPLDAADPYALSKQVDEHTAAMFCRRYAMSVAALRFHWVATRAEQLESLAASRAGGPVDEERLRGLWGYVDLRDAARACRLAVEAAAREPYGFVPMNVVATDILAEAPLADLLAAHAPGIEVVGALDHGGFSIARAERVIGWRPRHSWRDAPDPA